jgi:hypothetical protein
MAGRYDDGASWATSAVLQQPNYAQAQFVLAACHAMSGRVEEARVVCARLMQLKPALRFSRMDQTSQGGRYRKIVASLPDRGHTGMSTPRRLAAIFAGNLVG